MPSSSDQDPDILIFWQAENPKGSDLEMLIRFEERHGLIKLVQTQQLKDQLGISVDLITDSSLKNPSLKAYIYQELMIILDEEG